AAMPVIGAREALERLREGNRRFVSDATGSEAAISPSRRRELAAGHSLFAITLACSNSRVPAGTASDPGPAVLAVLPRAGQIVAPSQIGSVEFAAERYGTRLVVVLGHSNCGAILTTIEELGRAPDHRHRNLGSIVNRIRPSVESLLDTGLMQDHDTLVRHAVR